MPIEKTCQQCQKKFTVPNRRSDQVKFCSLACKTQAGWVSRVCGHCGAAFRRKVSDLKGKSAYCSRECYDATKPGRLIAKPDAPRYERVCEQCKVTFQVTKTRAATARFCSIACKSQSPTFKQECSDIQKGDKHWRFQGGKYKNSSVYANTRYSNKSTLAVHRQVFAAHMAALAPGHAFLYQHEGEWRLHKHIHVHHVDRNPANNDLTNLLALTIGAHAKLHHTGRKPEPWECWPPNPEKW